MNVEEFRDLGQRAFGWGWQSRLARLLGINSRTVRKWASGDTPVPSWVEAALSGAYGAQVEMPEWLAADDGDVPDCHHYILHLRPPRFLCRVSSLTPGQIIAEGLMGLDLPLKPEDEFEWRLKAVEWARSVSD